MVYMRTMVGIDIVKSLVNFFSKFSTVTSPALLVPPALKSEKKEILNNFFFFLAAPALKKRSSTGGINHGGGRSHFFRMSFSLARWSM